MAADALPVLTAEQLLNEVGFDRPPEALGISFLDFPELLERLQNVPLDDYCKQFLGKCFDEEQLTAIVKRRVDILSWAARVPIDEISEEGATLLATLVSYGLLPEECRVRLITEIQAQAVEWLDIRILHDRQLRALFTRKEFDVVKLLLHDHLFFDLKGLCDWFCLTFSSDGQLELLTDFRDNMAFAKSVYYPDAVPPDWLLFLSDIELKIAALNASQRWGSRSLASEIAPSIGNADGIDKSVMIWPTGGL